LIFTKTSPIVQALALAKEAGVETEQALALVNWKD